MLSPYRIESNNTNKRAKKAPNTIFDNYSHCEHDPKRPQLTSNDIKTTQRKTKPNGKNKNILKAGSMHESAEIDERYLDEILHKSDI